MRKKSLIFIFLFLAGLLSFVIYGYYQATPSPDRQITNRPQIEISPKSFDFGEIDFGKVVKYNFQVKNTGKEALEIKRVATSCACTAAKIVKEELEPGETAELLVSYDTAAMGRSSHGMGKQERIIYVKSNDPVNPQVEVMISAYVK